MKHINIISLVSLTLLSACGSQADSGTEHTASVNSSLPAAQQGTSATIAAAEVADTLHGAQQSSSTDAPSAPVATPEPSPVASPAPVASDVPVPIVTPVPTPSVTPSPTPTPCQQVRADGTYDYTCGLWILSPLVAGVCNAHAAELELIYNNGGWYNGSFAVSIDAQGDLTWNGLTLSANGSGTYQTQSQQAGRTSTTVTCYFNARPAQ